MRPDPYDDNSFGEISTYDAGDFSYAVTARDKLGRITEKTETVEGVTTTYNYTYDPAGRLIEVWENGLLVSEYTYDDNGNRTSKNGMAFSYDDQDRLVSGAYSSYTYTANGDVLTKTNVLGTTTYDYDATGNLTEVILPNNDEISYIYDGRNRRIAKMINGAVTERFIYQNQLKPAAKVDANGNILEQYIYGTRINTPDYIIKNNEQYRVVSDERGSVRLVVKVSDGAVSQRIDYDEFGIVIADSNPGFQPFYYAGGVYDLDTQLVKFGARDYDPSTGRWLQKEPLGFNGSDNFYSYCNGDPVNYYDYWGTEPDAIDSTSFNVTELWDTWVDFLRDNYVREKAKEAAEEFRIKNDLEIEPGGLDNALKHCYASCMVKRRAGSVVTVFLAELNETIQDTCQNQQWGDKEADRSNNATGIGFGEDAASDQDCYNLCSSSASDGFLKTYEDGSTKGYKDE